MKGLKTKHILRASLKNTLPNFIINKKKSGFNAPIGAWFGLGEIDEFKFFNKYVYDLKVEA